MVYPQVNTPVQVPEGTPDGTLFVDVGDTVGVLMDPRDGLPVSPEDCARGYWSQGNLTSAHAAECVYLAARANGVIKGVWRIDRESGWSDMHDRPIASRPLPEEGGPVRLVCELHEAPECAFMIGERVHLGQCLNPIRGYFL